AEASICRRRILLNYFSESLPHDCHNCDICLNPPQRFDGTLLVQKALSGIVRCEQRISIHTLIDLLRGTLSAEIGAHGYHTLKTFGVGRDVPARDWKDYLLQMLQLGYFEIAYDEGCHLKMTPAGAEVLYGRATAQLSTIIPEEKPEKKSSKRGEKAKKGRLNLFAGAPLLDKEESEQLFEELRALRRQLSEEELVPPYVIMSDKVLHLLCSHRPTTIEAFGEINGIGEYKKRKYGDIFTKVIKRYVE
ncbi:MAG: RQC domain-containing protein, partial [Bacteroides sp.]